MINDLGKILFLDIETVSVAPDYSSLDERIAEQWDKKSSTIRGGEEMTPSELFDERAGIFAEFAKVVTIAIGFFTVSGGQVQGLRIKAIADHDEEEILLKFKSLLESMESKWGKENVTLCAHNGKEFDFPFICRRLLINGIPLPHSLNIAGKKPWEIKHEDTMELWKFGDRKSYTSLDLLATIFNIESSKSDIDGSMVNSVYYNENDLEKIAKYCMQDVAVTSQLYLKLNALNLLPESAIQYLPIEIDTF